MRKPSEPGRDGTTSSRRARPALSLAAGCLAVAGSTGVALAASLGVTSDRVGAGGAAVLPCDGDGFTYSFTTEGGDVTGVTVGDIANPGCEGGVLRLTLTNATGTVVASVGPEVVPTDGGALPAELTVATDTQPPATSVAAVHASLEGP